LFGEDYNHEDYSLSVNYLYNEGYIPSSTIANSITVSGRHYFENWILDFSKATDEEKIILNEGLSEKFRKFLKLGADGIKMINNAVDLIKAINKFSES
jgi:hypothetical protein